MTEHERIMFDLSNDLFRHSPMNSGDGPGQWLSYRLQLLAAGIVKTGFDVNLMKTDNESNPIATQVDNLISTAKGLEFNSYDVLGTKLVISKINKRTRSIDFVHTSHNRSSSAILNGQNSHMTVYYENSSKDGNSRITYTKELGQFQAGVVAVAAMDVIAYCEAKKNG